jgi:hypothetical protein
VNPSEQAKAEAALQLAEEIMDAFEHDGWPGVDYIIDMIARYDAITVSAFPKIIAALGWQRGTVEQVVAEVVRLKAQDDAIKAKKVCEESHSQPHPGWKGGKSVADPHFGSIVGPMLGRGATTAPPDHGAVKTNDQTDVCMWYVSGGLGRASCDKTHSGHGMSYEICPHCGKRVRWAGCEQGVRHMGPDQADGLRELMHGIRMAEDHSSDSTFARVAADMRGDEFPEPGMEEV